ncbi:HMG box transcription factor BBX [Portunus trituberculatus]|uniref:HMG box transcription factor BBX n=1 Tax=Portunus trituberculatus TaxID=210409 RepID=A0A5B7CL48_PORTR|nr:HMG box transcription factor BBX [Portunus trituberculatus]
MCCVVVCCVEGCSVVLRRAVVVVCGTTLSTQVPLVPDCAVPGAGGVVRERYPHLENRQVTKILGEWWADLPFHQKTSYTELAKQYKEAFLRANPDFKWYKIPAQPPRPPPARPSNQKVPRCNPLPTDGAITFGKLAGAS